MQSLDLPPSYAIRVRVDEQGDLAITMDDEVTVYMTPEQAIELHRWLTKVLNEGWEPTK
jgi:hypothetical protein